MQPERLVIYLSFFIYCAVYNTTLLYVYLACWAGIALYHILSPWKLNNIRKRATIATWDEPREGIIQTRYLADVTNINAYMKEVREKLGIKVTLTHIVVKAIGELLKAAPDVNGKIVLGKYIPYDTADVSVIVDVENGKDLHAFLVENVDKMTIEDIAEFFESKVAKIKKAKDSSYKIRTNSSKYLPSFLMSLFQELGFLFVHLGFHSKALGIKKNGGGGAGVTNVGIFGVQDSTVPLVPFGSVPAAVAINAVKDRPMVKNGKIEIAPSVYLNFTIDHRFMDGSRAKTTQVIFDTYLQNPWKGSRLAERKTAEVVSGI